ncbi:uncharacterized protein [Malus domestica]|uniref:uncharacterized protein n=1 Tax=Malus domestica TaxID=3750 RepID=UPI003974FA01
MGSLLAQNNEGGKEQAIYYLSKVLIEVESRYTPIERLCLALYFTACKLRHYMLPCHIHIIAKTDVIKAIKGQAIVDFLAEHQESQEEINNILGTLEVANVWISPSKAFSSREEWIQKEIKRITSLYITPRRLYFDGSCTQNTAGDGIVVNDPRELGATEVEVFNDSELVINQLNGEYKCRHITMADYYLASTQLLS